MRKIRSAMPAVHPRRAGAVVTGALLLSLTAAVSSAPSAAAAAAPLRGAATCADIDFVYQPQTAFPNTSRGRYDFRRQVTTIETAVLCLVNAERTAPGLNLRPLKRYLSLGKGSSPGLGGAAAMHAADAVRLRWWGKVEPGKNCRPMKDDPSTCDPHVNPQTGSTPLSRAEAVGYGRRCTSFSIGENAYVGWGSSQVTPRAAVTWWMNSKPHRANILSPTFTEMYTRTALGSADPAAGSITPAVTYVQMFGRCN
ncbi:CAP domain-containing protein [Nonomuraea sp. NPDC005983]|uniref:CAP domain-containing protein n=1 Tax=Nonomuraea sp. NPDC005983 TaxID=3155595 RepID=UPI0033BA72B9